MMGRSLHRVMAALCVLSSTACFAQDRPTIEPSVPQSVDTQASGEATGGGGGATGDGNAAPANSNQVSGSTTSRPTCSGLGNWDAQAAQFEAEVLVLVNQARASGVTCGGERMPPVPALHGDAKLDCIARSYAKAMSDQDFFSHTGADGSSPFDRIRTAYPSYRGAAENIAAGQDTAQDVMASWLKSSGHCSNMMGNYTLLGVGMYKYVWVQNFLRP